MDQFTHRLDVQEGVVAVRLAARQDGAVFVPALAHAWPVEEAAQFNALLHEIDHAECHLMGIPAGEFR
jgi:hypothetical protein